MNSNPLSGIEFNSYDDVAKSVELLMQPLLKCFSECSTNVQIDSSGACFGRSAISLEGFARPLWGLVPYEIGGNQWEHWHVYLEGLRHGTDPDCEYYWGDMPDNDQRLVELAAISFAIILIPEKIFKPLDEKSQANVVKYLQQAMSRSVNDSNWRFFTVFIALAVQSLGYDSGNIIEENLERVDKFHVGDGWYRDGLGLDDEHRIDYYNPFAFGFYQLILLGMNVKNSWTTKYESRIRVFAEQFANFFDTDGSSVPYGRSLTYRFAAGAFWGALPFIDFDDLKNSENSANITDWPLEWSRIKSIYLKHLSWWSKQPLSYGGTGLLSVGYFYPNTFFSEIYNSACSPYWAFKVFLPLALSRDHPFWASKKVVLEVPKKPLVSQKVPGFIFQHRDHDTTMFVSGPQIKEMRFSGEKYGKFAYSTKWGFSVESDLRKFDNGVFDNMIAFSIDEKQFSVRDRYPVAAIGDNVLYSEWSPYKGVFVSTWILPETDWHVRVHIIDVKDDAYVQEFKTIEGGFCVPRSSHYKIEDDNGIYVQTDDGISGVRELDIGHTDQKWRTPRIQSRNPGNTNLIHPFTLVPQLKGAVAAGRNIYVTGVLVCQDIQDFKKKWIEGPKIPAFNSLPKLADALEPVGIISKQ